ncbi:type II toxin-antitoxin system RelB/DinJ family antitoxin [Treponema primitia]|uniref:type II toxin-antitoxin system RelB/DinJ family antitoxin n=1 Tax=Treponema primitia TaxID=88058 RepID=UPI0002554F4C|nr:type II toxin-antitoxin system RelB/DinJ family antitoxin [Treponema primitia]
MAEPRLSIRIDEKIKKQADEVFRNLGLNMSAGITIYLTQVAAQKRIPFPLTLEKPSEISKKADVLEQNAKRAVQETVSEMKGKGVPIALYDSVKKQPYLEYPDGRKQYRISK